MQMNESLFHEIINTSQDCIFWKDKDRRFVGVNQAFLDFYGFESMDALIGRTDEDMGWHSDPVPYMADELRVLEGKSTYKVPGKCIVRGEERSIVASKRPIYQDDRIVGLVGCFTDVTEVMRRHSLVERTTDVYTNDRLRKYPYFDSLFVTMRPEEVFDPLTGLVSKVFILEFIRSLITQRTAFSMSVVDIDHLGHINDTYGRRAGDEILSEMAGNLARYTEGYGVLGRLGGDELILIDFKNITYQERAAFFEELYYTNAVLAREFRIDDFNVFVSATTGSAACPADSDNSQELALMVEKALYSGKENGRGRYVIYDSGEHHDQETRGFMNHGILTGMQGIVRRLERTAGFDRKIQVAFPLLKEEMWISGLFYVNSKGMLCSPMTPGFRADVSDITYLMSDDIYAENDVENIREVSPMLYKALTGLETKAFLVARIGNMQETDGYLLCTEIHQQRTWREDESGILYFLARFLGAHLRLEQETIPE